MSHPFRVCGCALPCYLRGNERKLIYFEDGDVSLFLEIFGDVCKQFNWVIHVYCLISRSHALRGNA
jgi:putative transposase